MPEIIQVYVNHASELLVKLYKLCITKVDSELYKILLAERHGFCLKNRNKVVRYKASEPREIAVLHKHSILYPLYRKPRTSCTLIRKVVDVIEETHCGKSWCVILNNQFYRLGLYTVHFSQSSMPKCPVWEGLSWLHHTQHPVLYHYSLSCVKQRTIVVAHCCTPLAL